MKKSKQLAVFLLALIMLVYAGTPVFADVILEPNDGFYKAHEKECEYHNYRKYTVNTDAGHAYLYKSPSAGMTVGGYPNGEQFAISWVYTDRDGRMWGLISDEKGWFLMSDLTVVYDSFSFLEEHRDELKPYVRGTYKIEGSDTCPIVIYNYPGSKSEHFFTYQAESHVEKTYTDSDGNVWGLIPQTLGYVNAWICLTDPYSDALYPKSDMGESSLKAEPTPTDEIPMSDANVKIIMLIGILVVGIVIITAAVMYFMFHFKKDKDKTTDTEHIKQ